MRAYSFLQVSSAGRGCRSILSRLVPEFKMGVTTHRRRL